MEISKKFVAYCDILGFKNAIIDKFDEIIKLYNDFKADLLQFKLFNANISVYSDSILIIGDTLFEVSQAVQILHWTTLRYKWLIRGGIAYGRYWKESDEKNLFVVSEALAKAVIIEEEIKNPVVAISAEIQLDFKYWAYTLYHEIGAWPIIYYKQRNIVNPINKYWFNSAITQLNNLKADYPDYSDKYDYLLTLIEDMKLGKPFISENSLEDMVKNGVLKKND